MEKYFLVHNGGGCNKFKTQLEAEEKAKRMAKDSGYDTVFVLEAVAAIKTPVPEYEVVKL